MIRTLQDIALAACMSFMVVMALFYRSMAPRRSDTGRRLTVLEMATGVVIMGQLCPPFLYCFFQGIFTFTVGARQS